MLNNLPVCVLMPRKLYNQNNNCETENYYWGDAFKRELDKVTNFRSGFDVG